MCYVSGVVACSVVQGVRLAVAHSTVAIGNLGGLLECISMVGTGRLEIKLTIL